MVATLDWQPAKQGAAELPHSAAPSTHRSGHGQAKQQGRKLPLLLAAPLVLAAGLVLTLLLVSQRAAVFIPSFQLLGADKRMHVPPREHALSALLAAPRTNATMAVLPPFEPTFFCHT